jgi:hypothetical protein
MQVPVRTERDGKGNPDLTETVSRIDGAPMRTHCCSVVSGTRGMAAPERALRSTAAGSIASGGEALLLFLALLFRLGASAILRTGALATLVTGTFHAAACRALHRTTLLPGISRQSTLLHLRCHCNQPSSASGVDRVPRDAKKHAGAGSRLSMTSGPIQPGREKVTPHPSARIA